MPTTPLKLVFMGSPDFAVPVLAALLEAGHRVAGVYCQPPRPAGRGHHEKRCPVHAFAEDAGLAVLTPASLKDEAELARFADFQCDAAVVAAYGLILPKGFLEAPRLGCFNVHASLLPRWRGAAPIQRAILAGDAETGITIMRMDEGLDSGPIVLVESLPIAADATALTLHDGLAALGARLIVEALAGVEEGRLHAVPQPAQGVTYAAKLGSGESRLDWQRPVAEVERAVRAFNPWPGAWFEHEGQRIKVLTAETVPGVAGAAPGTALDDRLSVACGEGALRPRSVQRAGRAPATTEAFLRGYTVAPGTRLA